MMGISFVKLCRRRRQDRTLSLSRRSFSVGGCSMCGPHFFSMRITEDVRKFAAEQKLSEDEALRAGMEQKAKEFVEKGAEVYAKT